MNLAARLFRSALVAPLRLLPSAQTAESALSLRLTTSNLVDGVVDACWENDCQTLFRAAPRMLYVGEGGPDEIVGVPV